MFIFNISLGFICVFILSTNLPIFLATSHESIEDEDFVNLHVVEDICPRQLIAETENSTLPSATICQFQPEIHCSLDAQCRIGSKCCPVDDCHRMCLDLKDGSISKPKVNSTAVKLQRRKRQSFGCVACACIRNCRSDNDCRRSGRRKRCYRNSCSSYCTV